MGSGNNVIVRQNDLDPPVYFVLWKKSDPTVGQDVSASTAVVSALFRLRNATSSLFTVAACDKVLPSQGLCKMEWPADSLDVDAGNYEIEITITWNGRPETVEDIIPVTVLAEFGAVS